MTTTIHRPMTPEDTLAYESHNRTRQTTIAAAAGALLLIAAITGLIGPHAKVSEQTLSLITQHKRASLSILSAVINAVSEIGIAATLIYLWQCTRRRVETTLPIAPILAIVGVSLAVIGGVAYAFEISSKANEFVTTGAQTYDEANRLTGGVGLLVLQVLSQLGALLIAISFVLVSLQTMRVGLLPRFMGYVGMFAGFLVLFPIIVIPVVQLYWLIAIAILLSGNWPSGLPPAWRSGQAEAWPSATEARARRAAAGEASREQRSARKRGAHRERVSDAPGLTSGASPSDLAGGDSDPRTHSGTPKRKRKRRH
jgi:hypothetical protein